MEKNIIESNRIVAKFMGAYQADPKHKAMDMDDKYPDGTDRAIPERLLYHSSWSWLMPVVQKILFRVNELDDFRTEYEMIADAMTYVDIDLVWGAVVDFLTSYNDQMPIMGDFDENGDCI